jgi:hypothetical protein
VLNRENDHRRFDGVFCGGPLHLQGCAPTWCAAWDRISVE